MQFYLGTHLEGWLGTVDVPLCVSYRRLMRRKRLPVARTGWLLDSGGFTELSMYGRWTIPPEAFVAGVRRIATEVGHVDAAAIQDWMCEPPILASTGLTVRDHQRLTIESYQTLTALAPEIPWMPVVQGWDPDDYDAHLDQYAAVGINLAALPLVGVGTVCRRQAMGVAVEIVRRVASRGVRIHGFGFKLTGLTGARPYLASADSLAWSFDARRSAPIPGHPHKNCANCLEWALRWRERVLGRVGTWQLALTLV